MNLLLFHVLGERGTEAGYLKLSKCISSTGTLLQLHIPGSTAEQRVTQVGRSALAVTVTAAGSNPNCRTYPNSFTLTSVKYLIVHVRAKEYS